MIKTARLKKFNRQKESKKENRNLTLYNVSRQTVDEELLNHFFETTLWWCHKTFGKVQDKPVPKVEWTWNLAEYQKLKLLAEYDNEDNVIYLRVQGHRTIYNLTRSVIHEYIHYLQPTKGNWYERYNRLYGYWQNPYEIEATYIADLWAVDCTEKVLNHMGMLEEKKHH